MHVVLVTDGVQGTQNSLRRRLPVVSGPYVAHPALGSQFIALQKEIHFCSSSTGNPSSLIRSWRLELGNTQLWGRFGKARSLSIAKELAARVHRFLPWVREINGRRSVIGPLQSEQHRVFTWRSHLFLNNS